jgi:hypothetical protein
LAAESALIDGEAVVVRPDGHCDFAALRTKAGSARACFVAFDLLNLNGEDFRQRLIEERRAALSPLVAGVHCILFSDALVAEGALVFAIGLPAGPGGDRLEARRQPIFEGNSRQCLKSKNSAFCENDGGGNRASTYRRKFLSASNVRAAIGGRPAQASSINVGNSAGNRGALIKKADSTDPVITVRDNKRTSACNVTANEHDGCERLAFLNSL